MAGSLKVGKYKRINPRHDPADALRIEEYLKLLPENILNGEGIQLPARAFREIFKFAGLGEDDIFYHLGCNDESGVKIAVEEFNVKSAVGIDYSPEKIYNAKAATKDGDARVELMCTDIKDADLSDATVILFWFFDEGIVDRMQKKFKDLKKGTRIITMWGPLPGCLPDKVSFPYIINEMPSRKAETIQDQLLAIFGVKCVDFVTAWEYAERYTKAVAGTKVKNDRFLTIIQTLLIWINAKQMGVACSDEMPESIRTYINIMREHFDIDFEYLLDE